MYIVLGKGKKKLNQNGYIYLLWENFLLTTEGSKTAETFI